MKIAVVYWSGTGNTEAMAGAVCDGARSAGAEVLLFTSGEFDESKANDFDAIAFGCPAMGAEALEEGEFEPMFAACEPKLGGKRIALFGSYGWGDGQWMRDWCARCQSAGAQLYNPEGCVCNEEPDMADLAACHDLGRQLANW